MRLLREANGRWQPGTSPNPGGRPKGRGLKQEIERKLAESVEGTKKTRVERIAEVLVEKAEQGDLRALELILKRVWPERLAIEDDRDSVPTVIIRDYTGLGAERLAQIDRLQAQEDQQPDGNRHRGRGRRAVAQSRACVGDSVGPSRPLRIGRTSCVLA